MRVREALFPDELPAVRALFEEYAAGLEIDLGFQGFAEELASLSRRYARPGGGIWLAEVGEELAGCVALRPLDAERAEMKRLYVRPAFRRSGAGRALAERAILEAAAVSYRRICLDTLPSLTGAIALYRSLGFTEIGPYYHNPVIGVLFLGLELPDPTQSSRGLP